MKRLVPAAPRPARRSRPLIRTAPKRRRPRKARRSWLGWAWVGLANGMIGWLLTKTLTD